MPDGVGERTEFADKLVGSGSGTGCSALDPTLRGRLRRVYAHNAESSDGQSLASGQKQLDSSERRWTVGAACLSGPTDYQLRNRRPIIGYTIGAHTPGTGGGRRKSWGAPMRQRTRPGSVLSTKEGLLSNML